MVERMPTRQGEPVRQQSDAVSTDVSSRAAEPIPTISPSPNRAELVAAARRRVEVSPTPVRSPLNKVAVGAGIGVGGTFAAMLAAQVAGMWGLSKVMNSVGDFFATPIVKGILKVGAFNPFKWAWNKIVGEKGGGSSHGGHHQAHGGGHGHH